MTCWSCGVALKNPSNGGKRVVCENPECARRRNNFVDNQRRSKYRADLQNGPEHGDEMRWRMVQRALGAGDLTMQEIAAEVGCGVQFVKRVRRGSM